MAGDSLVFLIDSVSKNQQYKTERQLRMNNATIFNKYIFFLYTYTNIKRWTKSDETNWNISFCFIPFLIVPI